MRSTALPGPTTLISYVKSGGFIPQTLDAVHVVMNHEEGTLAICCKDVPPRVVGELETFYAGNPPQMLEVRAFVSGKTWVFRNAGIVNVYREPTFNLNEDWLTKMTFCYQSAEVHA